MSDTYFLAEAEVFKELNKAGLSCSKSDIDQCFSYTEALYCENKKYNLTRISRKDAPWLHIYDSLLLLPWISGAPWLDIGTGGGFPGVPLAVATHLPFTLLDSVHKKIDAVTQALLVLRAPNISPICNRVEDFSATHKRAYAGVVARAVSSTDVLLEYAEPVLQIGGKLLLSKGEIEKEEVTNGERVARALGFALEEVKNIKLPHSMGNRTILLFRKEKESTIQLPRKRGMATKRPLSKQIL